MHLTWFDANSWLFELGQQRVLVDPWLIGPLVFGNLPWFFIGKRPKQHAIPDNIDLILLSQGLPDHAHPPTLAQFDRSIPVVASASAAKVVKKLGYTQVTTLVPEQTHVVADRLEIRALPGALLGPQQRENGYLLKQLDSNTTLYYEPHGFYPSSLHRYAPVDVAINPIITLQLPLLGPIIQGNQKALDLAQLLQPKTWLPTASGGTVIYEGLLAKALQMVGTIPEFRAGLIQKQLQTQVIEPIPGERVVLQM